MRFKIKQNNSQFFPGEIFRKYLYLGWHTQCTILKNLWHSSSKYFNIQQLFIGTDDDIYYFLNEIVHLHKIKFSLCFIICETQQKSFSFFPFKPSSTTISTKINRHINFYVITFISLFCSRIFSQISATTNKNTNNRVKIKQYEQHSKIL